MDVIIGKWGVQWERVSSKHLNGPLHQPYRNKHTQIYTLSLGMTALLPYSKRGCANSCGFWEKLNRGVSKPGCFPLFSGQVQIVSRTLSGLFLVGALNRPGKRKRTNRENPRTIPEQIGKIPGKVPKGQKRTKKEGQVQIGKPPRLKHPRLAALEGLELGAPKSHNRNRQRFPRWRSQLARNPAERRGFGLRNRSPQSHIASDFPSHP